VVYQRKEGTEYPANSNNRTLRNHFIYSFNFPIPLFLKSFIFGTAFLSLIVTLVNFWWKISIHSVGAGALIGLVMALSLKMLTPLEWHLILTLIIAGLVLSSRLKLNHHSPLQVWAGLFTGFFGLVFFMMHF
jgi:hypothetical protein